jgi:hypothetical protein
MSIIVLRGFSNSGKDYVGRILCDKYNYKRFAFADSLKKIVAKDFNCTLKQLHTQEGKLEVCQTDSNKRTYRQILIDEALRLRNIDTSVFAKHCCQEIYELDLVPNKIVITDWRYPNELQIIIDMFPEYTVTPVHIVRQGQLESPVDDISEYHLLNRTHDYTIINNMDESIYDEIYTLINLSITLDIKC